MFKANVNHDDPPAMPVQMVFSQFLAGRLHFGGQLLALRHSKLKVKAFYLLEWWWNVMKSDEMWWNVMKSVVTSCYQLLYTVWKRLSAQLGLMDLSAASEWVSYHELSLCSPLPLVLMFFKLEKKAKKRNHMENQKAKLQNRKKQLLHLVGYLRMKI